MENIKELNGDTLEKVTGGWCCAFRPHRGTNNDSSGQTETCPSCGMPVQSLAGVMPGTCPHCGQPIPR